MIYNSCEEANCLYNFFSELWSLFASLRLYPKEVLELAPELSSNECSGFIFSNANAS